MHQRDDSRPDSRRPSLLSADQSATADAHSILNQLDGKSGAAKPAASPHTGRWLAGGGVLVAALGGLGLAWIYQAPVRHATELRLADAAPPPPQVAAPVSRPAPVVEPVSAATILDAAPMDVPGAGEKTLQQALGAVPADGGPKGELVALLDKPSEAPAVAKAAPKKKAEPVKTASKEKKAAPKAVAAKSKPVRRTEPAADSDVALLAALLAHSKTTRAHEAEQEAFRRCAALPSRSEAQRCRTRLCEGSAKGAPECKPIRTAKVSS